MSDHQTGQQTGHQTGADALVERLLDLALYAPVGVAVTLRDDLPRHVKQGRQALENRIQLARFIGQLAVQTGQRELQKRIEQQREARLAATAPPDAADGATSVESDEPDGGEHAAATDEQATDRRIDDANGPREASETAPDAPPGDVAVPAASELPISDYESLPAINVVDRLRSMSPDEIELVRRFEQAHRARRTILAKIDQLQERHAAE